MKKRPATPVPDPPLAFQDKWLPSWDGEATPLAEERAQNIELVAQHAKSARMRGHANSIAARQDAKRNARWQAARDSGKLLKEIAADDGVAESTVGRATKKPTAKAEKKPAK